LENDRYGEAVAEFLNAAKIHENVEGQGSRCAAGDWVSAAVASVFDNKNQNAYAYYLEALSNLDLRIRNIIDQPLAEEDEEELVLLEPEVVEQWLGEHSEEEGKEVREIWEFCAEISERLEGFSNEENMQANQEDVAKLVQEMLAQELGKLVQEAGDDDDGPVNDLGVVSSKKVAQESEKLDKETPRKRPLEDAAELTAKRTKLTES